MLNMSDTWENLDPNHLTKGRLKSELIAHNVPLPRREQKKEVYVQLYLKHITSKNKSELRADFSSDEEDSSEVKSTEPPKLTETADNYTNMNVTQLSDEELKEQLVKRGVTPGPIVATTRMVYEKKLLKSMGQGPAVPPPKQNGTGDVDQYSDSEEEEDFLPEGSTHSKIDSSYQRHSTSKVTVADASSTSKSRKIQAKETGDVLTQMFQDEMSTPAGISATRRRPIKGAAGRPIQYNFDDLMTRATVRSTYKEKSNFSGARENKPVQRLVPMWLRILLFIVVVLILFLVYQAMESNQENPFASFLEQASNQVSQDHRDAQSTPNHDA
ncbi:lamina-associated polypeptide 2, isoforms beta/gamma-like [Pristis pectinata]|uniref:lamina-associated polypeptide 2, isoforms beta/gamma-like n=1 Tax=Pristis pectinata TaxID=685728 RepID=UPI00223C9D67|nr:lamina-associated polypeptide 2, isoforms beta/gamma-like [Pristis pectinata]